MNNYYNSILLLGGSSSRFNNKINKVLMILEHDYVFNYSLKLFVEDENCQQIIVVVNEDIKIEFINIIKVLYNDEKLKKIIIISGGATRLESVQKGIRSITNDIDKLIIHDGARPLIRKNDIDTINDALNIYDASTLYEKCTDTYRIEKDGLESIDRNKLMKVVTPQGYLRKTFNEILYADCKDLSFTDEVSILIDKGYKIKHLLANHSLQKLTTEDDFEYIRFLLTKDAYYKIGHSFDFHAFEDGNELILGGIHIPYTKKLKGHSDADALFHAITEAIIGALSLGDIGKHFPDNDSKYKMMNSQFFMEKALEMLTYKNYEIVNIDSIIYLEKPKLKEYKAKMEENIAKILNITKNIVNVKATTLEKKGLVGTCDGIGAEAVVLIKYKK